jgi:hypothetical protein
MHLTVESWVNDYGLATILAKSMPKLLHPCKSVFYFILIRSNPGLVFQQIWLKIVLSRGLRLSQHDFQQMNHSAFLDILA